MEASDIVVTRDLEAPLALVRRAWSEDSYVKRWWGPDGFISPYARMDVREGGSSLVSMRDPEGRDHHNLWTYERIEPERRIEFVSSFADADGNRMPPAEAGLPPFLPQDVRHIVTLEPLGPARTRVTVVEQGYEPGPVRDMSESGQRQVLDRMAALPAAESDAG